MHQLGTDERTSILERPRRDLDLALGVLIGTRRCREHDAFSILVDTATRHRIGVVRLAREMLAAYTDDTASEPAVRAAVADLTTGSADVDDQPAPARRDADTDPGPS